MKGQRVSYMHRNEWRSGTIIGKGDAMGAPYFVVKADASGMPHNVLPQNIIERYYSKALGWVTVPE